MIKVINADYGKLRKCKKKTKGSLLRKFLKLRVKKKKKNHPKSGQIAAQLSTFS